ncbi:transporter substrate-binding domain-containing protein [Ilumatobacter sp.]|uniref:glutamate ABC transporter substrate-binding protein n=1 Tax=Ilumatobacter sp. TaxID=1967498 RepID=UPI003B51E2DA
MRSTYTRIVPCLAATALVVAACGSDDTSAEVDDAVTDISAAADEAMSETSDAADDAMAETTDAMTETSDAMTETTDAMTETSDAMTETTDAMTESTEAAAPAEGGGGTLRVGTKYDQPLFGVNTPSGVEGFDADIARYIGEQLGREVEFSEAVSANRESFLENGTVDMVVATYTINDERDEIVDFAGPYYVAGQDIMVTADNPLGIASIDDLDSPDVATCTVEGSTSLDNLNEMAPDANVTTFDTYSKCADAMGQGRVDAVTTDNVILLGLADESGGEYVLVENPFTEEPYGIGVPEGSELRCEVNEVLQTMYDDGTWQQIYEDTVGAVASQTPEPPELDDEGC